MIYDEIWTYGFMVGLMCGTFACLAGTVLYHVLERARTE